MPKRTKIKLQDGLHYDGVHIDQITLRRICFADTWFLPDIGTLPGSFTFISRLSGVPVEALSMMTQVDALTVLEALSAHIERYLVKRAR